MDPYTTDVLNVEELCDILPGLRLLGRLMEPKFLEHTNIAFNKLYFFVNLFSLTLLTLIKKFEFCQVKGYSFLLSENLRSSFVRIKMNVDLSVISPFITIDAICKYH